MPILVRKIVPGPKRLAMQETRAAFMTAWDHAEHDPTVLTAKAVFLRALLDLAAARTAAQERSATAALWKAHGDAEEAYFASGEPENPVYADSADVNDTEI